MVLPITVKVEATPNFLANLDEAYAFFKAQVSDSADFRLEKLKSELRDMIPIIAWSPASGRPARFLSGKSAQACVRTETVLRLAQSVGLPFLREYVVGQHIVLYAHSETDAVLLALKHQRQLTYFVNQ